MQRSASICATIATHVCAAWVSGALVLSASPDGPSTLYRSICKQSYVTCQIEQQGPLLKQKGITHVVLIGLIANTCIESTGKYAAELGYHVTLVRDATAAASVEAMHCAHDINGPTYAQSILRRAGEANSRSSSFGITSVCIY